MPRFKPTTIEEGGPPCLLMWPLCLPPPPLRKEDEVTCEPQPVSRSHGEALHGPTTGAGAPDKWRADALLIYNKRDKIIFNSITKR
jgi:hypothetical protein